MQMLLAAMLGPSRRVPGATARALDSPAVVRRGSSSDWPERGVLPPRGRRARLRVGRGAVAPELDSAVQVYERSVRTSSTSSTRLPPRSCELRLKLLGGTPHARKAPKNTDAYDLYLRGRHLYADRSTSENVGRAIDLYRRAIELDPQYALPWSAVANAYSLQADLGITPMETAYALARVRRLLGE